MQVIQQQVRELVGKEFPNTKINIMNTRIVEYIRDKKRRKIGVVVAIKHDNKIRIGWSKVKRTAGDVFDKDRGIDIAVNRAIKNSQSPYPFTIFDDIVHLVGRAAKYFKKDDKNAPIVIPPIEDESKHKKKPTKQ